MAIVDILRRAEVEVVTAALKAKEVQASRRSRHLADTTVEEVAGQLFDAMVLPGGQPGTNHLKADARVIALLKKHAAEGRIVAAICAAPLVLHEAGLLKGRKVTCFPGVESELPGVQWAGDRVVVDGRIVTSRAPGTALEFSLKLVEMLCGAGKARQIAEAVLAK